MIATVSRIGRRLINDRRAFVSLMFALGIVIFAVLRVWADLELGLVVAIALGVPPFIYASVQFAVAAGTVDKLVELEQQLSTRRLDEGARFIKDIVELMKGAKKEVIIFCDYPAYSAIKAPKEYLEYLRAIYQLRRRVRIKLLCLDEKTRCKLAKEFFAEGCNGEVTSKYPCENDFLDIVAEKNARALLRQFGDAEKHETSFVMPLYFWIVDEKVAVFSLRRFPKAGAIEEWGFQTSDGPLVEALRGIFDKYCDLSASHALVERASL